MVLFNLKRCEEANAMLDLAFAVIDDRRRAGGVRNTDSSLSRTESNLLVARAHCSNDVHEKGRILYSAVEMDPSNEYAVNLATQYMEKMEKYQSMNAQ